MTKTRSQGKLKIKFAVHSQPFIKLEACEQCFEQLLGCNAWLILMDSGRGTEMRINYMIRISRGTC